MSHLLYWGVNEILGAQEMCFFLQNIWLKNIRDNKFHNASEAMELLDNLTNKPIMTKFILQTNFPFVNELSYGSDLNK
jgi:hypothetical protein